MKRRSVLLVLFVLAAVLTWTACGKAPEAPEETGKPAVTEAPEVEETQVPAVTEEPETESPSPEDSMDSERISYPFDSYVPRNIPVPEKILDVPQVYSKTDENNAYLVYAPADRDTLQAYLKLCAYSGWFNRETVFDDGITRYALLQPGSDLFGVAYLDEDEDRLVVTFDLDCHIFEDEELEILMSYYLQDLTLPTENGRNVMPQFYASVGQRPYLESLMGDMDYCFDGAMCWTEMYAQINFGRLWRYASDMMLCGFDVWYDATRADDNGCVQQVLLHFSNGDAEVIVMYDAEDETAVVHYKPGVSYNLISGEDYLKYIP